MINPYLRKLILVILILSALLLLAACQGDSQQGNPLARMLDEISRLPDRLVRGISNLFGGLSDIGSALAEQVRDIIGNMTGR